MRYWSLDRWFGSSTIRVPSKEHVISEADEGGYQDLLFQLPLTQIYYWSIDQYEIPCLPDRQAAFAGMTHPPENVSSITEKLLHKDTSFLKPTKEAIRNLLFLLPLTPPKRIVIPLPAGRQGLLTEEWGKNTGIWNQIDREANAFKSDPGIVRSSQAGVTIPFIVF